MSKSYRWYVIGLLTAIAVLNYADRQVISALLPLMRSSLGMSDAMLGTLGAAFLWPYAVGSPLTGFFADRLPRVKVIVWSLVIWSLATVLSGLSASAGQMLATRVLLGIGQCAYAPAAVALIAGFQPPAQRALAIGIFLAGYNLGIIVGGFLGGFSGDHFGWRPAFLGLGASGLILAVVTAITLRRAAATERRPAPVAGACAPVTRAPLSQLFKVPSYLVVLTESCSLSVSGWMLLSWLSFFYHESYGLSLTSAALAATVPLQIAATLGYGFGGYVSDRFAGPRRERRMLLQSICFTIGAPFILIFATGAGIAVISCGLFIASIFRAVGSTNDQVLVCEILPPSLRATGIGLMNGINIACGSVGVLLAGVLLKRLSLSTMFASTAFFYLCSAAATFIGYRKFLQRDLVLTAAAETGG